MSAPLEEPLEKTERRNGKWGRRREDGWAQNFDARLTKLELKIGGSFVTMLYIAAQMIYDHFNHFVGAAH